MAGRCILIFFYLTIAGRALAQNNPQLVTVAASTVYQKSGLHQWFFGSNWRQEWGTPVRVPVVMLDTVYGGLRPYAKSGGGESRSLRLRSIHGKEYVLRSIAKYRADLLPKLLRKSLYGSLSQDGVSMSHPYGAFAVPVMLGAAGILHARPQLVYLPQQAALDSFNTLFANNTYLLEERPAGNWSDAPHLGHFTYFLSTAEVTGKLHADNRYRVDQEGFLKARLFDILVSDVDRHQDNWRWGAKNANETVFQPIPRDRDQAFFTHNGWLTKFSIWLTRRRMIQNFNNRVKNVRTLTNHDIRLDQFFTNEMTLDDWMRSAHHLQQTITDSVMQVSIGQMPAEVVALSGNRILEKLKSRRSELDVQAARYYYAMARKVEVNGSAGAELFQVRQQPDGQVAVNVFRVDSAGNKEAEPYYSRLFTRRETKRVTLYGFGGNDRFDVARDVKRVKIRVRTGGRKAAFL